MRRSTGPIGLLLFSAVSGLLVGCSSMIVNSKKTPENIQGLRVTSEQLRVRTRVMVKPLTGMIIEASDAIYLSSDDPAIRRASVVLKTEGVPSLREALYTPSPIAAILDAWALSFQMMDYFRTGTGALALGDRAPIALRASEDINQYIRDVVFDLADDELEIEAEELLKEWASANPITVSIASRESIVNQVAEISLALGLSLGDVVDVMVTTADDLNRKLDLYSDQLPKQARWEAELFTMNVLGEVQLGDSLKRMPELFDNSIATLKVAQAVPEVVAAERQVVIEALSKEVAGSLAALREERIAILEQVAAERAIVMAGIEAQRIALTADLRTERMAIEAMFARERETILEETEDLRERLIADAFDKVLVVLLLIGLYLAGLTFAILWFVGRLHKNRPTE